MGASIVSNQGRKPVGGQARSGVPAADPAASEALVKLVLDLQECVVNLQSRLGRLESTTLPWGADKPKKAAADFAKLAEKVLSAWGPEVRQATDRPDSPTY